MLKLCFALAAMLLAAVPAEATWKRAESRNFIIYGQSSEASLRGHAALLEDYHDFLRLLTGIDDPPPANKLSVYLVRGRGQLRTVRDLPEGVAGFYTATSSGIAAFANERADGGTDQILLHEIAHHFMMQYRPLPYPGWYVEGFAEYVMTAEFEKDAIEFGRPSPGRVGALTHLTWLPFERVLSGQVPREKEPMALFYAQSWLLVHYLLRDAEQRSKVSRYMTAVVNGADPQKAFAETFGLAPKQLEKELRAYAAKGMTYSRLKRASAVTPPPIRIGQLSPAADELLLLKAAMDVRQPRDDDQALLARVRTEAAQHSSDPFARRVLAQAEAFYGDAAKADALLDPLLAAAPHDVELLYLKGMRYLVAARAEDEDAGPAFQQARKWFVRAHNADKKHFQTLIRYAESLRTDRRFGSENTINILLLAHELAPQVQETAVNAARLLLAQGRFEEAEGLLTPLAADPHNSGLAEAARRMLVQARARAKPATEAGEPATAKE